MEITDNNLPYRLKEELINFLYMNKLSLYKDFELLNHVDFSITLVPLVKSLYDKAVFYNICIQKLILYASQDKENLIELAEKYFSDSSLIEKLITIAKKDENIQRRFKTPLAVINRNDYVIDKNKKFIYLVNSEIVPNQIHFSDNEFYSNFSNKYPVYFPTSKEVRIKKEIKEEDKKEDEVKEDGNKENPENAEPKELTEEEKLAKERDQYEIIVNKPLFFNKNQNKTTSNSFESLCEGILSILESFTKEYNEFLSITNKESFLPKDKKEEERKQKEKEERIKKEKEEKERLEKERLEKEEADKKAIEEGQEGEGNEKNEKVLSKEEVKPEEVKEVEEDKNEEIVDIKNPNPEVYMYNQTMVIFICKENNENNRLEQLFLINELFNKYSIYAQRLTFSEIKELITEGYACKDEYGNLSINGKIVSLVYYNYNILEDVQSDIYEFLEISTAVKCPNIYSTLANLKPILSHITQKDSVNKYFKEEELINEILRFLPKSICPIDNATNQDSELLSEIKKTNGEGWIGFNYKNYYEILSKNKVPSNEDITNTCIIKSDNLISTLDSGKAKEVVIQENFQLPSFSSVLISNKDLKKQQLTNRLGIFSFSLILDNKVLINKNLSKIVRSAPVEDNFLLNNNENYAVSVPLLRQDINIKTALQIDYDL